MNGCKPFRPRALVLALAGAALLGGCKKDSEVNETLDRLDETTKEIVTKVTSADDPAAGVADAQAYLDGQKDELHGRIVELGEVRGFQISEETTDRLASSLFDNTTKVEGLKIDLLEYTMNDPDLEKKLDKLADDYGAVVNPQ